MRTLASLMLWLIGWSVPLMAQHQHAEFEFHHIQQKEGLSFNLISSFLQDRNGFLWIGTFDGLNRFDGGQFVHFKNRRNDPNSIMHNTVRALCEDRDGNIWIGLETGISRYDKTTGKFHNLKTVNGRALGLCSNILCDQDGTIWFTSYYAGLFRYDPKTDNVRWFPLQMSDNLRTVSTRIGMQGLVHDPLHKGLWIADKREGLLYFDIARQQFIPSPDNPQLTHHQNHFVTTLAVDEHRLLFADETDEHIVIYDLEQHRLIRTVRPVSRSKHDPFDIATLFVDRQHNLWTSSWNNTMFFIEAGTYQISELVHQDANPLSIVGTFFWCGWQHSDGSIWLGTVNGISYTNPQRAFYSIYNVGSLFPALTDERGIVSFHEDADGSWWLGTSIRGLLHYDPRRNRLDVYRLPNHTAIYPYGGVIRTILPYGDELLIGTVDAIFRFNRKHKTFTPLPSLPPYVEVEKKHMEGFMLRGDELWVAGQSKQVYCYNIRTQRWQHYPIASQTIDSKFAAYYIFPNRNGSLWLQLYPDGFARLDTQTNQFVVDKLPTDVDYNQGIANTITSCVEDTAGNFWLASDGHGLLHYDTRSRHYQYLTESEGLIYDHCGAALPDRSGNIWVSALNRFSVYIPSDNQFINFTLPFNESTVNYGSYLFPLRNGHILAALHGYLVEFFPEKLRSRSVKMTDKVLIGQVDTGDTSFVFNQAAPSIHLEAGNEGFAVHFGSLSAASEAPFYYKYQLDGYDDWKKSTGPTYVIYNKIPGGNYTFKIKGVASDGQETPISTLSIRIDSLFYRTFWFWGLVGLVLAGIAWQFVRYRTKQTARVHRLQVQATRLERDKTDIQYKNLINHLNPHFLFNSLTSLNSLINTNPKEASAFLRKLSVIYRYILQNKDKELVSLQDELTFAQNYIDLQKARFDNDLQITVKIAPDSLTRQIVPVTIQNLLENAIKHNVLSDDQPLHIRIYTEDDTLYVVNSLQKKAFVETSNRQGLASLQSLYRYLSPRGVVVMETNTQFIVQIPLL